MLFSSLEFLFLFLPITLAINFILPLKAQNYWLMLVSLLFYAWGEPDFLIIMLLSIVFNYFSALKIVELQENGHKNYCKFTLIFSVGANLLLLTRYKYMNFLTESILHFFPSSSEWISQTHYTLPIGISFFTFQAISYLIDVYRGEKAQTNICHTALYISLFPQLIAGPIVRYHDVAEQIENRQITFDTFSDGIARFLKGFNKKVLLANTLAIVADTSWGLSDRSVAMAWLGAFAYAFQIFYDFSGYSDMAIGLGKMFGFTFLENFNYPYISKTISEFWRRWHISLGSWFRDYVYIPLGGSHVASRTRLIFNLSTVWILTGIWHGANWTFLIWGIVYAVFICIEKLSGIEKKVTQDHIFGNCYQIFSLFIVLILWVLFRSNGLEEACNYLLSMLNLRGNMFIDATAGLYFKEYFVLLVTAVICSTPALAVLKQKLINRYAKLQNFIEGFAAIFQFLLFFISLSYLLMDAYNPFIYFNF